VNADALQTRFARAVEAEYARQAAAYRDAGASPEQAHERALEDAKRLGHDVLEGLRRRGLFPWPSVEAVGVPVGDAEGARAKRSPAAPDLFTKEDAS